MEEMKEIKCAVCNISIQTLEENLRHHGWRQNGLTRICSDCFIKALKPYPDKTFNRQDISKKKIFQCGKCGIKNKCHFEELKHSDWVFKYGELFCNNCRYDKIDELSRYKYQVINSQSVKELEETISEFIHYDWLPAGGVTYQENAFPQHGGHFMQAVYKKDKFKGAI